MNHDALWAPWRLAYVAGAEAEKEKQQPRRVELLPGGDHECFLCRAAADTDDRANLVVHRNGLLLTVLNRFPYNNGHLLVAPLRHEGRLSRLTAEEHAACLATISRWTELLEELINADGFNVGLNLGRAAGAGVPGHLHWHIVPRWNGDTNFMPSLAGVKVIPQALEALWELLHGCLD